MLKFASFDISEADKINELLAVNRLPKGRSFIVSEGKILVPYEDGQPEPKELTIIDLLDEKDTMEKQKEVIVHSQKVLDVLIADAQEVMNTTQAAHLNATSNKALEEKYQNAKNAFDQLDNQYKMNQAEIARIDINLRIFDDKIGELKG